MTLGNFLDAAFAALIEEYRRLGSDLQTALAELDDYRAGGPSKDGDLPEGASTSLQSEAAVALQNERSMAELKKMMAGVGGSIG